MNEQTACIASLVDLKAGIDVIIAEMMQQNWAPYIHTQASRIPAIRRSAAALITDVSAAMDALGNAGVDCEINAAQHLKDALTDTFDDAFDSAFEEMEGDASTALSVRGRAESRADDAYQSHREAAE